MISTLGYIQINYGLGFVRNEIEESIRQVEKELETAVGNEIDSLRIELKTLKENLVVLEETKVEIEGLRRKKCMLNRNS